jgi:hypothetical protein
MPPTLNKRFRSWRKRCSDIRHSDRFGMENGHSMTVDASQPRSLSRLTSASCF